ncbi:MAG: alpha,alpha-phosphotrehalase [Lactobacillaceae bacterium]|jgi:trehalose-6-phosphate hydrolase|nr:alpha,alpha-phosphotrehalase [Lactobacillaceae bacterium]
MDISKEVVYQIYPKSFQDSNGDGIGDLPGIIQRLPYLAELGITMLWLSPIFTSPQKDNGYDISDYRAIDQIFGTLADFDELILQADRLGIGVMLDMVFNHTSIEHAWFQKALAGDAKYQAYYLLRERKSDGSWPNNWQSKFGGAAWSDFDSQRAYLHLYDKTQADLDWRNPAVRQELAAVVNFWLAKGVKGLRFDVINVIGKAPMLQDDATGDGKMLYTDQPIAHEYLRELAEQSFEQYDAIMTVGELSATSIENTVLYTRPERHELSMSFSFHHLKVDYQAGNKWTLAEYDFEQLRKILLTWGGALCELGGWPALFWNNHDQPRAINRFIADEQYYERGAKLLAGIMHLNRGTPYIYMGEEFGMVNPKHTSVQDFVDVESINAVEMLIQQHDVKTAVAIVGAKSRDNSRVPMKWRRSGGFTIGKAWLPESQDCPALRSDYGQSIFAFYQELISLRKTNPIIAEGNFVATMADVPRVIAFQREFNGQEILVIGHFNQHAQVIELPMGQVIMSNLTKTPTIQTRYELQPYELLVLALN